VRLLLFVLLLAAPVHQVSGTVKKFLPWCGGVARPGQVVPAKGVVVGFYPGETFTGADAAGSASADADGGFKLSLPDGKYCVRVGPPGPKPEAIDGGKETPDHVACRLTEWSRCDQVLEVKGADVAKYGVTITGRCAYQAPPCYDGPPLPPPPP
jgi:hypothetical protein